MTTSDPNPRMPTREVSSTERMIVVRALASMRDHDSHANPPHPQVTQGHIAFARAMEDAVARGEGSRATLSFDALEIVFEVLGPRASRITVRRKTVAAPYPKGAFDPAIKGWPVQMKNDGDGTYVFDIEHPYSDGEALANVAEMLEMGSRNEFIDEAEARKLGILPPLEN